MNDFPELRAAVRESAIGTITIRSVNAIAAAGADARVTRAVTSWRLAVREMSTADTVQCIGVGLATAAMAGWALSLLIPPYLGTTIPSWGFFAAAALFATAAMSPSMVARHWSQSRMRRISLWLREP